MPCGDVQAGAQGGLAAGGRPGCCWATPLALRGGVRVPCAAGGAALQGGCKQRRMNCRGCSAPRAAMCLVLRGSGRPPKLPQFAGIVTWELVPLMCGRQAQPPPWLHWSAATQGAGWRRPAPCKTSCCLRLCLKCGSLPAGSSLRPAEWLCLDQPAATNSVSANGLPAQWWQRSAETGRSLRQAGRDQVLQIALTGTLT